MFRLSGTEAGSCPTSSTSVLSALAMAFRASSSGRPAVERALGLATSFMPRERRRFLKLKIRVLSSFNAGVMPAPLVGLSRTLNMSEISSVPGHDFGY